MERLAWQGLYMAVRWWNGVVWKYYNRYICCNSNVLIGETYNIHLRAILKKIYGKITFAKLFADMMNANIFRYVRVLGTFCQVLDFPCIFCVWWKKRLFRTLDLLKIEQASLIVCIVNTHTSCLHLQRIYIYQKVLTDEIMEPNSSCVPGEFYKITMLKYSRFSGHFRFEPFLNIFRAFQTLGI